MEQQIRFCTTSDGVRIAYATAGEGPPLVFCPGIYGHVELDWEHPWRRAWFEGLARRCRLIRYDARGTGLSQRGSFDFSANTLVSDLEAVVDQQGLEQFTLGGRVLGGATAMLYAARHPEKVRRLILLGTANRGTDLYTRKALRPLLSMARSNWAMASVLTSSLSTGAVSEEVRRTDEHYVREAVDGETFARLLELSYSLDLTSISGQVTAPTLVMHQRDDRVIPIEHARRLASCLPNGRFLSFDGDSNAPWHGSSTDSMLNAIIEFCELPMPIATEREWSRLVTILFTDMEGSTSLTQRLGDAKAQELLRTHNTIVRDALKAHGGAEIKHTGDGIMASFTSASRALACATAIQTTFAERNETAEEPIKVRIGLNAGEPVAEDEDLFGTAVQLAARVCAHAEPGQVLASNVVRELSAGKPFLFSDQGDVVLRGFEDPVRLYEVRGG